MFLQEVGPRPFLQLSRVSYPDPGRLRVQGLTEDLTTVDTDWMNEGKCRDLPPETFFPSDGVGVEVARRICADCPVKAPCLEYALYNRIEHGVWGGASERERRRIARQRRGLTRATVE
jgi:WhiB family redox-sensing transcriptional regulator